MCIYMSMIWAGHEREGAGANGGQAGSSAGRKSLRFQSRDLHLGGFCGTMIHCLGQDKNPCTHGMAVGSLAVILSSFISVYFGLLSLEFIRSTCDAKVFSARSGQAVFMYFYIYLWGRNAGNQLLNSLLGSVPPSLLLLFTFWLIFHLTYRRQRTRRVHPSNIKEWLGLCVRYPISTLPKDGFGQNVSVIR